MSKGLLHFFLLFALFLLINSFYVFPFIDLLFLLVLLCLAILVMVIIEIHNFKQKEIIGVEKVLSIICFIICIISFFVVLFFTPDPNQRIVSQWQNVSSYSDND